MGVVGRALNRSKAVNWGGGDGPAEKRAEADVVGEAVPKSKGRGIRLSGGEAGRGWVKLKVLVGNDGREGLDVGGEEGSGVDGS